jgi:hypothetical protein
LKFGLCGGGVVVGKRATNFLNDVGEGERRQEDQKCGEVPIHVIHDDRERRKVPEDGKQSRGQARRSIERLGIVVENSGLEPSSRFSVSSSQFPV